MAVRRALALLLALAALVAVPAAAQATIRVQRGMAGVELNMTKRQVRAELGAPQSTHTGMNDFGRYTEYRYPDRLRVFFQSGSRVTNITTGGRAERTSRGVGVGSSERSVRNKVRNVRCETIAGSRTCHVGSFRPGRRVTDFKIRRGRVYEVVVGFVVD